MKRGFQSGRINTLHCDKLAKQISSIEGPQAKEERRTVLSGALRAETGDAKKSLFGSLRKTPLAKKAVAFGATAVLALSLAAGMPAAFGTTNADAAATRQQKSAQISRRVGEVEREAATLVREAVGDGPAGCAYYNMDVYYGRDGKHAFTLTTPTIYLFIKVMHFF